MVKNPKFRKQFLCKKINLATMSNPQINHSFSIFLLLKLDCLASLKGDRNLSFLLQRQNLISRFLSVW